jgi:hypothetical protein
MKKPGHDLAVALVLVTTVACHAVNHADAITLLNAIEQIAKADVADPDQQTRFLMQACAEVPFCALGCRRSFLAAGDSVDANAAQLIAECSPDYKNASPQPPAGTWFRGYLKGRLDVARSELSEVERARLDDAAAHIRGLH